MNVFIPKKYSFYVVLFVSFIFLSSITHAKKLLPPNGDDIYFGAMQGFSDDENFNGLNNIQISEIIEDFDSTAGKNAMWVYFANNWYNNTVLYPQASIQQVIVKGKLPFIRFMPFTNTRYALHPCHVTGVTAVDNVLCDSDNNSSIVPTIQLSDIASGVYDSDLRAWAVAANNHYNNSTLNPNKIPLLMDFAVEMNGYWFEWGGAHQSPTDYKEAYKHIIDIFREENVEHVTWFFHPVPPKRDWYNQTFLNQNVMSTWADPSNYYPGDDYIDWIGISLYGREDPALSSNDQLENFSDLMVSGTDGSGLKSDFQYMLDIAPNKPLAILEFGAAEGFTTNEKANWFIDAFGTILSYDSLHNRRISAISYWNESWNNDEGVSNLMSLQDSRPESRAEFKRQVTNDRFISTPQYLPSSLYEDAEDGNTNGWVVYDNNPAGATVTNVYDSDKNSNVINFSGQGKKNGYRLGHSNANNNNAWGNTNQKIISWDGKFNEGFSVYVAINTTLGSRHLLYADRDTDLGIIGRNLNVIHHGIGFNLRDGQWHTVIRDLEADLQEFEPNNQIVSVNGFIVRGSGRVDNIELLNNIPLPPSEIIYEDAEDGNTNGWIVYDSNPAGAIITNVYDSDKNSNVINFSGQGKKNGYRLGHSNANNNNAWGNTNQKIISWDGKFNEGFSVYVAINTTLGSRHLLYTDRDADLGIIGRNLNVIHHGIGSNLRDGQWHTVIRDLEADLQVFEPNNQIVSVNGFIIRGSGRVDNIKLKNSNTAFPSIFTPANGTTLSGSTQTFNWRANGNSTVNQYWLEIGTSEGMNDLFQQNMGLATSKEVPDLPTDGSTIYVRLYYNNTDWDFVDFTYTTGN